MKARQEKKSFSIALRCTCAPSRQGGEREASGKETTK